MYHAPVASQMATQLDTCKIAQLKALALGLGSEESDVTNVVRVSDTKENKNECTSILPSTDRARSPHNRRGNPTTTLSRPMSRNTLPLNFLTHTSSPPTTSQPQESNPELPNTIPDSLKLRMATSGSQSEGDTQPISQRVIEEYNNRSKLQDAAKQHMASNEGTGQTHESTERSYHPGQTGHVDILGAFEQPSRVNPDEISEGDDEDFDPLSPTVDVRAELYPESKRFQLPKTPAPSKKRDRAGDFINRENSTPRLPINPFAGQMVGVNTMMDASQAFKATQAVSSPLTHVITSDGLSQRPSPDMYSVHRPSTADPLSSPSKMTGLGVVRAITEPRTKYISMQESQEERDRLARRTSDLLEKSGSESSDDFGSDNSQLRRRRFQKKMALIAKNQFDAITAPERPGSSRRKKKKDKAVEKKNLRSRSGKQLSDALIVSDDPPIEGNVTEDETEQEEHHVDSEAEELDELAEENKENVDVPMTISKRGSRNTQIFASQPTPSRQYRRDSPKVDHLEGSNVLGHSSDLNEEEHNGLVETQRSAVTDSQSSHSHRRLEARDSIPKGQPSRSADFPFVVPSSSPALARKSQVALARDQHEKSGVNLDDLSTNANPIITLQQGEPNEGIASERHSSPLSELPTLTPPSTNQISFAEDTEAQNETIVAFTAVKSAQSALPEVSTGSTPFETARTSLVESKLNHQHLQRHSEPAYSSSSVPLRSIAQIAADPSPPDAVSEVDIDINLLTSDDIEFQAVIKGSSPVRPLRKRRHGNSGWPIKPRGSTQDFPSDDLYQNSKDNIRQDTAIADELAAGNLVSEKQMKKNNEVINNPISSSKEATNDAPRKTQNSKGRPPKIQPLKGAGPGTLVVENEGKGTLSDPLLETSPTVTKDSAVLRGSDSEEVANRDVVAPDRVFAHFNGNLSAFYPATCLGVVGRDQSRYKVRFDDGTVDTIRGFGIKRLELRVGDSIKADMGGSRTNTYVVQRFNGQILPQPLHQPETHKKRKASDATATRSSLTDVFGYSSVVVIPKKRQSTSGSLAEDEISVPVKDIYLTQSMWTHFKDRPYSYIPAQVALPKVQTPSEPSTPSTPSSRGSRTKTSGISISPPLKSPMRSGDTLFENMVFAITNIVDEDTRKLTNHQIIDNGGYIVEDGFDELFDIPTLEIAAPAKQSPKKVIRSKFGLTQSAQSFGFTCLIADKYCRRAKYIQALALGIPCLATRWIKDCVAREQVLPWGPYLLASGESSFLQGSVRSRILPTYPPNESTLSSIVDNRPKLLDGESVLLIMSKNEEEKMKFYPFFTHALGASKVSRAPSLDAAVKAIAKARTDGQPWDRVYSHDNEKQVEKVLFGGGRKRKRGKDSDSGNNARKKPRVVGNEFVIQSLILGQLMS